MPPLDRSACGRRGRRDGFTLVEALVALAVLAAMMVPIEQGVVAARLSLVRVDSREAALAVARTLLNPPATAEGVKAGSGTIAGHDWIVTVENLPLPFEAKTEAGEAPAWLPMRVTVQVAALPGRPVSMETVRLVPAAKP